MSRRAVLLVAILVTAAVVCPVRLAAHLEREASHLSSWHFWTETDEWAAVAAAKRISSGNVLDVPAYRPYFSWQKRYGTVAEWDAVMPANVYYQGPAYPYFLALAGIPRPGAVQAARLAQLLLAVAASTTLAATAATILLRARRGPALSAFAGVAAGVLHGLYGPLVFLDGFLYRDGPVAHVSALLLAIPLLAERPSGAVRAAGLGVLSGAAALLKQTALPLGLLSGAVLVLRGEKGAPQGRAAAAFLAGLLVALGPLVFRNSAAGAPPLAFDTRPLVGIPWANARGADGSGNASPLLMQVLSRAEGSTLGAAVRTAETWREKPLGLVELLARKFASAFNQAEIADNASFVFFRDRLPVLSRLPLFVVLLGPGLAGLVLAERRDLFRRGEGLLVAGAGLVPLGACVLVSTTTRYRSGAAAPLALGTALLGALVFETLRQRRWRGVAVPLAAAALLSALAFLPSAVPVRRVRWADTIVAATLAEALASPEAGVAEIRCYLKEAEDDTDRVRGRRAANRWLAGDRSDAALEPEGVAPPEKRYRAPGS
ncbi:MAG TPA: hypothetical protein VE129_19125 [Thermoanaerobaculia bacterium]|nr:hypothetical protein [Thermoanaerobaculia bacterium]